GFPWAAGCFGLKRVHAVTPTATAKAIASVTTQAFFDPPSFSEIPSSESCQLCFCCGSEDAMSRLPYLRAVLPYPSGNFTARTIRRRPTVFALARRRSRLLESREHSS